MTEPKKRGRPAAVKPNATTQVALEEARAIRAPKSAYRIAEKNGKHILYHGSNVRQVFPTREKAEEYLGWVTKPAS